MTNPLGPLDRQRLLDDIDPHDVGEQHALLREIFQAEMRQRPDTGGDEFFENLYHCAFLLYLIGDPSDVPMMWQAKHLDFDTSIGFDVQFLLGAGVKATLDYLNAHGRADIAQALAEYEETSEDLHEWEAFRRDYFYDPD
ncbi:hypothetical protein ACGFNU_34275 [Spirillospora sp. NPDC048911]|uniref:hypothetical protein n=1 Tax=Spirillospora sp. NPDC048911 TaxID=3364527 RepID=UPI00371BD15A